MDEGDKREVEKICWKTIFIAVVLVGIGVVIGRVTAGMCPLSPMGKWGGYSMKSCWNKGGQGSHRRLASKCNRAKKSWDKQKQAGCKNYMSKCKQGCTCPKCCQKAGVCQPGCTCPMCLKKTVRMSDPNKAGCPMMEKKTVELEKD